MHKNPFFSISNNKLWNILKTPTNATLNQQLPKYVQITTTTTTIITILLLVFITILIIINIMKLTLLFSLYLLYYLLFNYLFLKITTSDQEPISINLHLTRIILFLPPLLISRFNKSQVIKN